MNKGYIEPSIKFPIIVETPDKTVTFFYSKEPFTKINKNAFEKKMLHDSIIIDSDAVKYKIKDVENLGYANIFGGINIFLERIIYVKIILQEIKKLNFEELKILALEITERNKDYYISAGINIESLKTQIEHSGNSAEIVLTLIT